MVRGSQIQGKAGLVLLKLKIARVSRHLLAVCKQTAGLKSSDIGESRGIFDVNLMLHISRATVLRT